MADKYFWADEIAEQVIKKNPKKKVYVCASGITPSGFIHIGNFREVITTELVVRALQDKGVKVRFLYSWDDYDRFRKVPTNLEKSKYEQYIGMPLSSVPAPEGKGDYARYFERLLEKSLDKVFVKPEFIRQTDMNKKCKYAEEMKIALENVDKIKKILNKYRKEPLEDDWMPITIYCEKCMKDFTHVVDVDGYNVKYKCGCGHEAEFDIRKKGIAKLRWRVDWPARWKYEEVDFEPSGIDHQVYGGSFMTGKEIAKEIYKIEGPIGYRYEWIKIKGGEMFSSSSGNALTLDDVEEIYEPEVLRYIFAGTRPNKGFAISFDEDVIKIYEDFDNLEEKYYSKKANKQEQRMYELSVVNVKKKKPERVGFRHLVTLVQIGGKGLGSRGEKAKAWVEKYAPDNMKFSVKEKIGVKLGFKERAILRDLKNALKGKVSEKQLLDKFYKIAEKNEISVPDFFKLSYNVLIGKEKGPRLAGLILGIGKDKVVKLLEDIK